jgi:hypothetical protein
MGREEREQVTGERPPPVFDGPQSYVVFACSYPLRRELMKRRIALRLFDGRSANGRLPDAAPHVREDVGEFSLSAPTIPSLLSGSESDVLALPVGARRPYLSVDRSWVYEHAADLGARRLGAGPRARLRFSLAEVDRALTSCYGSRESEAANPAPQAAKRVRRRRRTGTYIELLPIRGRSEAA